MANGLGRTARAVGSVENSKQKKNGCTCFSILKTMSRKDRKRVNPIEESRKWSEKNINPPGFNRSLFENKGRGVRTIVRRNAGDFLLVYTGKVITTKEGENLEEGFSSGYRFCLQRFVC
uniref:Uncharacterized protein n=1 Tax=Magallana gigas TaxID=29159 RepID=A0A8W8MGQ9_MAGGI